MHSIALACLVGEVAYLMAYVYPFTALARIDAPPIADGLAGQR